jgi:serine protease
MGFSKAMFSKMAPVAVRARRGWLRPGVLVTLGALVISSGFALSARAATPKVSHPRPSGAIKLPKSSLQRVGGVVCGKVAGRWIPGAVIAGGYFLSDAQQAHNYAARARHETGSARKTDLGNSKLYTQRARQRQPICSHAGSSGQTLGGPSSTGAPAPTSPPTSTPATGATPAPSNGSLTPTPSPSPGDGAGVPTPPSSTTAAISVPSAVVGPRTSLPVSGSGFAPGSTVQLELHSTPTSLGSVVVGSDGTFSTSVTIPFDVEGGQHHVLGTGTGADGGVAAPEAPVAVDAAPPQLQSFSITPRTVDTSTEPAAVTVEARITDDMSGVAGVGYTNGTPGVTFKSPSGQMAWASFGPDSRISGNLQDGVYRTTVTVPRYSAFGTWTVDSFSLVDMVGNRTSMSASQMDAEGMPTTFQQTGPGDTTPPQLKSFSITPDPVDTSNGPQTITLEAHITDDMSGVAGIGYTNGTPGVTFKNSSGQMAWASFGPDSRDPHTTPQDGTYQTTITLPRYSASGTWTVDSFSLVDMAGNRTSMTASQMATAGMQTTFTNNQSGTGDITPPKLESFSITPRAVDTSTGTATITVEARITDDMSGVAEVGYTNGTPGVTFKSSTGQIAWASFGPDSRVQGTTPLDGTYHATITLPLGAAAGTWTVDSFSLVDMVGNRTSMTASQMEAVGMPTTFTND